MNREALIVLSKADPVALILAQHAQIAALTARIRAYARSGSMTQESKSVTVEERKPRSLLLMPFRFIGQLVLWVIVLAFVFHPSANVGAWGAIILALICTFTPKINLARLCPTHHWMYDAGLYSMKAIRLLKAHWKAWYKKGGIPDHTAQMKDAGPKAARKRKHRAAGRKAAETRLLRAKSKISQS